MDSGTSSIVELGRFLTGFLVVMGVGKTIHLQHLGTHGLRRVLTRCSTTRRLRALRSYPDRGHGHEHHRWPVDLRHDHQLHDVLSRTGGVLGRLWSFVK